MNGLFINYRREDSAPYAGRLCDHLSRAFPNNKVFMDIDAIDPGEDFVDAINQTLTASKVVIAVIGPDWETIKDGGGTRRLDNPDDYVVRELSAALDSGARVIPVLVGGAEMPKSTALPLRIQALARRNAIEISDTRFVSDAERLSAAIARAIDPTLVRSKEHVPPKAESSAPAPSDSITMFKTLLWTNYALAILGIFLMLGRSKDDVSVLIDFVAYTGILAFVACVNVKVVQGRNWARMACIVLLFLAVPGLFYEWSEQSGAEIAVSFINIGLSIWLIRRMFTDPIKARFQKR